MLGAGVDRTGGDGDPGRCGGGHLVLPGRVIAGGERGEVRAEQVQGGLDPGGAGQADVGGAVSGTVDLVMAQGV